MVCVSVVIVTWNAQKFIRNCVNAVFSQVAGNIEVIVVDNGSTDQTLRILKEYAPLKLIVNTENKGFCFANNQAIKQAKGKYILTLNIDIMLEKNYIYILMQYLEKYKKVGMVQGKFLTMEGNIIDSLGLSLSRAKRLFNIAQGRNDGIEYAKDREIFGPCAAAALYRKELINQISIRGDFFDNRFFFLVEDFDVAWRARHFGWKAMYVHQAVCRHFRGSAKHKNTFKQYLSFRNRYFLLLKNCSLPELFLSLPYFLIYDLPRLFFLFFTNQYFFKAIRELFQTCPQLIKERK
ncbi:MAG: hypothetical protein DRP78_02520 [Candidatus Omnitrophota bacterium]|nr:MAG: hypothetical protein DRP78_02520 [Candidatus Omnitrophota bacterium]